ncbi:sigma-70 family RNA polymerase sigma factor [Niabella sp.]|uniref:RNA polymerase sigma factor n=1 Tax=Niabella sp. TaxID=1962976 RepID=UPI002635C819|nr:sigma-70 family RNA polymerase sigma factor [Niabella sp.]
MMNLPDSDLLVQLKEGDHTAFSRLYFRYATIVYRRIQGLVKVHEHCEELVQEVFLQFWQNRHTISEEVPVQAVLFRIAKSTTINFYRKAIREERYKQLLIRSATANYDPVGEHMSFLETSTILNAIIDKLPPQRKKVFLLIKMEGKTYEEAARETDVSLGTIKDHMAKSMRTIRQELTNYKTIPPLCLLLVTIWCE